MSSVESSPVAEPAQPPRLSVVSGDITEEELAALTVVVMATGSYAPPPKTEPGPRSQARAFVRRALLALPNIPGPGSWRRKR
ncbi:acyl-CoA carboxylase subunit epsilon [Falsarthrobacter nasiphocae]|uniref:Acyl-CoA carboxylase subunit epsilon n=1 Tax=Falsarthrobacter nasiphocae TaxID=189863 RepID=A0AAE3YFQ0_9MICC|nr:acyl-CoA carboxylase subunit epsilon [Falsarthrobacter nasiphocae]MDR6892589.1 hypothetical protein [Falsarthrobacter nasiphocae]